MKLENMRGRYSNLQILIVRSVGQGRGIVCGRFSGRIVQGKHGVHGCVVRGGCGGNQTLINFVNISNQT